MFQSIACIKPTVNAVCAVQNDSSVKHAAIMAVRRAQKARDEQMDAQSPQDYYFSDGSPTSPDA
jgi:hypothetical protein